jgi:hypothetical protein
MITKYEIKALYILRGWEELDFAGAWFNSCCEYWYHRGFTTPMSYKLNAAGMNFAFYLRRGGSKQFANRDLLGGNWPEHWESLRVCRKLMQLDLHWSELAYQVTGTPNNRSALRARFDPVFREKHLRQRRESGARRRSIGKHYTGTKPKKRSTSITLAKVRGVNDHHT